MKKDPPGGCVGGSSDALSVFRKDANWVDLQIVYYHRTMQK